MSGGAHRSIPLHTELRGGAPWIVRALLRACIDPGVPRSQVIALIESDPRLFAAFTDLAVAGGMPAFSAWDAEPSLAVLRFAALCCGQQTLHEEGRQHGDDAIVWQEALATAHCARAFAERGGYEHPREAYDCGLLLRIGRHPAESAPYGAEDRDEEIARSLRRTSRWRLDPSVSDALRYAHCAIGQLRDADSFVRIMAVAERFGRAFMQSEDDPAWNEARTAASELLGLDPGSADRVAEEARGTWTTLIARHATEIARAAAPSAGSASAASHSLRRDVDRLALASALHDLLAEVTTFDGWWRAARQLAAILFGVTDARMLEVDRTHLVAAEGNPDLAGFSIRRETGRSILIDALQEQRAILVPTGSLAAVVDRQLADRVGGDALACLPMPLPGDCAVVVIGRGDLAVADAIDVDPGETADASIAQLFCRALARRLAELREAGRDPLQAAATLDIERLRMRNREITHEVNNPLAVVNNYLKILSMRMGDDPAAQHNLEVIQEELGRVSGIIAKFSELDPADLSAAPATDLNATVKDIAAIIGASQPGIEFQLDLGAIRGFDPGHRDRVKQILLNLLKNAVEAQAGKGRIEVRTRDGINFGGGMYIELTVADDGPGIAEALRQRLFEAAGTTKGEDHQGIGLSIVRRLVDEMNGMVSCSSEEGAGTEFRILLPELRFDN